MPFYIDASNYTCIHNIITRHDETGVDAVIYRRVLTHKSSIQLQLLLTTRFKRKQSHTHAHKIQVLGVSNMTIKRNIYRKRPTTFNPDSIYKSICSVYTI